MRAASRIETLGLSRLVDTQDGWPRATSRPQSHDVTEFDWPPELEKDAAIREELDRRHPERLKLAGPVASSFADMTHH